MEPTSYAMATWIEPEYLAYDLPLAESGRRARALCPDGKVRIIRIGIPDTFFSIPGRVKVRGKTVTGFVSVPCCAQRGVYLAEEDRPVVFTPYSYGKNGNVFA